MILKSKEVSWIFN